MKKYGMHCLIVTGTLALMIVAGGASVWSAKGEAKCKMSIGQHRIRFLPISRWGFSSDTMNFSGLTSVTLHIKVIGPVEVSTPL